MLVLWVLWLRLSLCSDINRFCFTIENILSRSRPFKKHIRRSSAVYTTLSLLVESVTFCPRFLFLPRVTCMTLGIYRVSQKSSPSYDFQRYFRLGWVFLHKIVYIYWQFRNLYQHMSTDFRLFIFTFNEMALILLRAPIIFTVSSFDCSAIRDSVQKPSSPVTLIIKGRN